MSQTFAVWIIIGLSLITANLPFVLERPLLVLPWAQAGEAPWPAWLRWICSAAQLGLLAGTGYLTLSVVGQAFFVASDLVSVALFMAKLAVITGVAWALLSYPGWRNRGRHVNKSFVDRMLELLVFYGLVGVLGFAFEANMGSMFTQTWEFFAVTLSLFLVLGYPGFVYRYLMRHRKARTPSKP